MNSFSMIDLITSALVGAALGGIGIFFLLKDKLKQSSQTATKRRINLLEQVAEHVGKVSYVFGKYASLASEIGPKTERMTSKQQRELEELSNELVTIYEQVSVAESKLLLLGEQRLEMALKLYTSKMAQFRKQIYPGRYSNSEEAGKLRREVTEMRNQFYNILSERYDQQASD